MHLVKKRFVILLFLKYNFIVNIFGVKKLKQIIDGQRKYFEAGNTLSYEARKSALLKLRECVKNNEDKITAAIKEDLGKSRLESYMSEIGIFYDDIEYNLKHLKKFMKPKRCSTPVSIAPAKSQIVPCPYGVVLIIAPWNYPFLLTLEPLTAALAAGNCCVIKPSELSPATTKIITSIMEETFPKELVCVINGGAEESKALLEEKFDYIFYTGNATVGRYVMQKAAAHLTPVTLELGGKSPVVITESANLRIAARRIAFGKFMNLGQTCVAPDYVLIEKKVHDDFIWLLKEEIIRMYGEQPLCNSSYGKIINRRHFERITSFIDKSKVVFGGAIDEGSIRISPTIMDGVCPDDAVMGQEIFGPVLPVICVNNLSEAYDFIQKQPHPLALYLFTQNKKDEKLFMEGLQFGGGCVNDTLVHVLNHDLPFGGIGESGCGVYHGKYSFDTFSHPKAIVKSASWADMPIRYQPYTSLKEKLIRMFI